MCLFPLAVAINVTSAGGNTSTGEEAGVCHQGTYVVTNQFTTCCTGGTGGMLSDTPWESTSVTFTAGQVHVKGTLDMCHSLHQSGEGSSCNAWFTRCVSVHTLYVPRPKWLTVIGQMSPCIVIALSALPSLAQCCCHGNSPSCTAATNEP